MSVRVTVKAKLQTLHYMGRAAPEYQYVQLPALTRKHVDMDAARSSRRYGGYANSDLFPGVLARAARQLFGEPMRVRLDQLPAGVTVDTSGFLAVVVFYLPE